MPAVTSGYTCSKLEPSLLSLPPKLAINQELGVSTWLTSLPIKDEGYVFNKQEIWDLLYIRYGWNLNRLPEKCACGVRFDVHHAIICKKGIFLTQRHNQLRNITAILLKEVFKNVRVKPPLQTLTSKELREKTVNVKEVSRVDISAIILLKR